MFGTKLPFSAPLAVWICLGLHATLRAEQPVAHLADKGSVAVLKSRSVLIGTIELHGKHYELSKEGVHIRFSADDVLLVATSLTEAYENAAGTAARSQLWKPPRSRGLVYRPTTLAAGRS